MDSFLFYFIPLPVARREDLLKRRIATNRTKRKQFSSRMVCLIGMHMVAAINAVRSMSTRIFFEEGSSRFNAIDLSLSALLDFISFDHSLHWTFARAFASS